MPERRIVPLILLTGLGCYALFAPAVSAKPRAASASHRLVSFRRCTGVLNDFDFSDDLEEVSPTITTGDTAATTCKYAGLTEELESAGSKDFTEGGLGVECLANAIKILGTGGEAPPGGCYRISSMSALFITGSLARKSLSKLEKGHKSKLWPTGFSRRTLPGRLSRSPWNLVAASRVNYLM